VPYALVATKTLAASTTDTLTIAVGGDPVEIYALAHKATSDDFDIQIEPSDTGKNLFGDLAAAPAISGTGSLPARIDGGGAGYGSPLKVLGGCQIKITLRNRSANPNVIYLVLYGFRLASFAAPW
jgi:hypothetical protein